MVEQGCGETSGLGQVSWYYNFLADDDFTQGRTWTWARENWDWVKKALVVIRGALISLLSTQLTVSLRPVKRLNEYKAFLNLNWMIWRLANIKMGIKEIAACIDLIDHVRKKLLKQRF